MQQYNFNNNYGTFGPIPPNVPPYPYNYKYIKKGLDFKTYEEKKDIKKAALFISIPLISLVLFTVFFGVVLGLMIAFSGVDYQEFFDIINEPAVNKVISTFISILIFTVPFIITFKLGRYRISNLVILSKPEKKSFLPFFLFGVSFCALANIATGYIQTIFDIFKVDYSVNYGENPSGFFGFMISIISTVAVPAFVEEFACRGIILGSLRKFGDGFAVMTSAILFGLMHGNFEQMPFAFMVGLILGFVTVKSGSMWIAIAVHAFNNFSSVAMSYFLPSFTVPIQNLIYIILTSIYLILGIVGILLLKNRDSKFYNFKKSETKVKEKSKYLWFFTSPLIIIFIGLCIFESLQFFV